MILRSSGGGGLHRGGDGIIREIEFLDDLSVGVLCERRAFEPRGIRGGENGARCVSFVASELCSNIILYGLLVEQGCERAAQS